MRNAGDGSDPATPTVERYVYDGQNIALTFDGNGTQTHRYFYGTGVDQILADENGQGQVLWTLTDNQGTVRDLVDGTGTVQNHITYDSFGKITSQTNPVFKTILSYTGREFDGETGQYYYRARYYDQNVGRFIGEDPIGFNAGDTNLYRYVINSPINFTDPNGKIIPLLAIIAGGALIGGGLDAIRQGIQIAEGSRKEFSWSEVGISAGVGAVAAPIVAAAPWLAIPFAGLGIASGIKQISCGNYATGAFDITTSLAPFVLKYATTQGRTYLAGNKLVNMAAQAESSVSSRSSLTPQQFGIKAHTKLESILQEGNSRSISGETSYLGGKFDGRYRPKDSSNPDAVFGNPDNPIAAFDLKTGAKGIPKLDAEKFSRNAPERVPLYELRASGHNVPRPITNPSAVAGGVAPSLVNLSNSQKK